MLVYVQSRRCLADAGDVRTRSRCDCSQHAPATRSLLWYPFMPIGPVTQSHDGPSRAGPSSRRSHGSSIWRRRVGRGARERRSRQPTSDSDTGPPPTPFSPSLTPATATTIERKKRALALFDHFKTDSADSAAAASFYVLWTIGLELEKQTATRDLAATAFEDSLSLAVQLRHDKPRRRASCPSARRGPSPSPTDAGTKPTRGAPEDDSCP